MEEEKKPVELPENAYRELKEGEEYEPIMKPGKVYPEANLWSVGWGLLMAVLFSAAAAYLGLKVGQVFEAAIPIAIIAVGVSSVAKRKGALGENVIIQSIGACSGVIVAGAIFTLPALYILQAKYPDMTVNFMQVFISSLLGGVLGILFLIPFRKYFVKDMHGKYPFPEATATTQVLISGEKGAGQAKPLVISGIIGGIYDFIVSTFGLWTENFTTRVCAWGSALATKAKLVFSINTGAAVLGLGYCGGFSAGVVRDSSHPAYAGRYFPAVTQSRHNRCCFRDGAGADLLQLCPPYRNRWYSDGRNHRHSEVLACNKGCCQSGWT